MLSVQIIISGLFGRSLVLLFTESYPRLLIGPEPIYALQFLPGSIKKRVRGGRCAQCTPYSRDEFPRMALSLWLNSATILVSPWPRSLAVMMV
jgi:hypothetical protein